MKKTVKSSPRGLLGRMVLAPSVVAALNGTPYQSMASIDGQWKPIKGKIIGCRVCGLTQTTLYKDGDDRICGKCRKKVRK